MSMNTATPYRRTLTLAHERHAIAAPLVRVSPPHVAQCVTCGFSLPEDSRVSRCPECFDREGVIAERNRRIARGEAM